jgi:hypothetical protein
MFHESVMVVHLDRLLQNTGAVSPSLYRKNIGKPVKLLKISSLKGGTMLHQGYETQD